MTPSLACVAIGTTFSVSLGQAVTTAVLLSSELPVTKSFYALVDPKMRRGRNVFLPYIDDISMIGTSLHKVSRYWERAASEGANDNLRTDKREEVVVDKAPHKVAIGLAWWKGGVRTVKPINFVQFSVSSRK